MKLTVVNYPDEILSKPARAITQAELNDNDFIEKTLAPLVNSMAETMLAKNGVGLAAPQVGVDLRVIVFKMNKIVTHLINPEITKVSEQRLPETEGCLSLPGFRAYIMRHRSVTVRGFVISSLDSMPKPVLFKAEYDDARVLQHEIDHLDGILMTARVGALDAERAKAFLYLMANPIVPREEQHELAAAVAGA